MRPPRFGGTPLLLCGLLLVAANLRGPLVAVAPVAGYLRHDLSMSAGTVGLLTSIPVLCFGLAAPLASMLIAHTGLHRAIALSMAVLLAGTVMRATGGSAFVTASAAILGLAITIGNVAVPVIIGRDFQPAADGVTAAYTAAMNLGATMTAGFTAALASVIGWRASLGAWGLLGVLAGGVWLQALRRARTASREPRHSIVVPTEPANPSLWRQSATWMLTVAFAAQSFSYYSMSAWLPTLLADRLGLARAQAGIGSSLFQILGIAGAFAVPIMVKRWNRLAPAVLIVAAGWATLPLGLLLWPAAWPVWCTLGGMAQGGGITSIFITIVRQAQDVVSRRRLSATVQSGGYVIAATGPLTIGTLHDSSRGWPLPLLLILTTVVVMAVAGVASANRSPSSFADESVIQT